jgi:hypothetical protein
MDAGIWCEKFCYISLFVEKKIGKKKTQNNNIANFVDRTALSMEF